MKIINNAEIREKIAAGKHDALQEQIAFVEESIEAAEECRHEKIARRAYDLYVLSGCLDGHDLDNWLQAEHDLEAHQIRCAR